MMTVNKTQENEILNRICFKFSVFDVIINYTEKNNENKVNSNRVGNGISFRKNSVQ
jgi:hypothetical protein